MIVPVTQDWLFAPAINAGEQAFSKFSFRIARDFIEMALAGGTSLPGKVQFELCWKLAQACVLTGDYPTAEKSLRDAEKLAANEFQRAEINAKLGELEFKLGDKEQSVRRFEDAITCLEIRIPKSKWAIYRVLAKELLIQLMHSLFPSHYIHRNRSTPSPQQKLVWHLFSRLAQGYWFTKDRCKTIWAHLFALNRAERYEPTAELAQAYSEHAPAMSLVPWLRRGAVFANRSLSIRQKTQRLLGARSKLRVLCNTFI